MENLQPHRRTSWRRPRCSYTPVSRCISHSGVRAVDLSRELARHRSLPVGASRQALSHGPDTSAGAIDAVGCPGATRLAHLFRVRPAPDRACAQAVCRRAAGGGLEQTVYALDSTTIDLCLSVFDWAPFRSTKAAIKLHTLLDLRGPIPAFISISDGKLHDVNVLDILPIEAGAFYVMDRGYLDFARLFALHQAQAFFVTRAKVGMDARRLYSSPVDRSTGVICNQTIALNGVSSALKYPQTLSRIRFKGPDSGKTLVFLTNHTRLPALTIAVLYKSRWQVELFFKWIKATLIKSSFPRKRESIFLICLDSRLRGNDWKVLVQRCLKQHLRIKQFYGTSENAVKTQIWCAVCVYVLVAIVKKVLQIDASLYTLLQILSVTVFEKTSLLQALAGSDSTSDTTAGSNQLNLFEI